MNINDLPSMVEPKPNDIQSCHDRIESLEARLAYAKALLSSEIDVTQVPDWRAIKAFIEKLNKEGL